MSQSDEPQVPSQSSLDQQVMVPLILAELVVLSDCLDRLEDALSGLGFLDDADRTALWALNARLESLNPVLFSDDYDHHLRQAKEYLIGDQTHV